MLTVKGILRKYNVFPKKKLSQSFLIDKNILFKIIQFLDLNQNDTVIEIGSGLGLLTKFIAEKIKKLIAIEIDQKLIKILKLELAQFNNIEILNEDFLKYNIYQNIAQIQNYPNFKFKIIGNIPYNISSQIIFKILKLRKYVSSAVLLFQDELAERILAKPGTKKYGVISVFISMYAHIKYGFQIKSSCFYPKPRINSTVIKIIFRDKPLVFLKDPIFFKKIVKTSFAKRRKTIFNNLKKLQLMSLNSITSIKYALNEQKISQMARAEEITPEKFAHLSNILSSLSN